MQKSSRVRKRLTPAQRVKILSAYRRSGLPQRDFALQAGISVSALQQWLRKAAAAGEPSPAFIPVPNLLASAPPDELLKRATLEIEYSQWYKERVKRGEQLKDAAAETEAINAKRADLGLPIEPGVAREAKANEDAAKLAKERDEALAKLDKQIADQQLRVDRAKAVRDEIEARGR